MAASSNFSEASYKRSKALDKERKYKENVAKKPEDTGSFDNMPHFKVRKKKAAKDNNIDSLILSDEDMKNFARNLADNINRSRASKETTNHILSSISRKY